MSAAAGTLGLQSLGPDLKGSLGQDSAHTCFHLQQRQEADRVRTEEHAAVCSNSTALADERADAHLVPFTTVVRMTGGCLCSEDGG